MKTLPMFLCPLLFTLNAVAGTESMQSMPRIQPKKIFTVQSKHEGEILLENRGFGDQEAEIRMMNLMMVEGSGFEGMDMSTTKSGSKGEAATRSATQGTSNIELNPLPPQLKPGTQILQFSVRDLHHGKNLSKLKPEVQLYMTNMDMGSESPKVRELKEGVYEFKGHFTMAGPWAVKIKAAGTERVFELSVQK